jgi:hypothetical protein
VLGAFAISIGSLEQLKRLRAILDNRQHTNGISSDLTQEINACYRLMLVIQDTLAHRHTRELTDCKPVLADLVGNFRVPLALCRGILQQLLICIEPLVSKQFKAIIGKGQHSAKTRIQSLADHLNHSRRILQASLNEIIS